MFRRLRQLALTLAALVSVVMLPIIVIAWAWPNNITRAAVIRLADNDVGVVLHRGNVGFYVGLVLSSRAILSSYAEFKRDESPIVLLSSPRELLGLRYQLQPRGPVAVGESWQWWLKHGFEIPIWSMLLLCLPAPILWWRHRRRAMKHSVNLCPVCNYDLRGTPGRCPECGWTQAGVSG